LISDRSISSPATANTRREGKGTAGNSMLFEAGFQLISSSTSIGSFVEHSHPELLEMDVDAEMTFSDTVLDLHIGKPPFYFYCIVQYITKIKRRHLVFLQNCAAYFFESN
jgi:hypothetical protein